MEDVRIATGGRLLTTREIGGDDTEKYVEEVADLTDQAMGYLFCNCTLEKNVVLKDIFLLLDMHRKAFAEIFHDALPALLDEELTPYHGIKPSLSHLVVRWIYEVENEGTGKKLYGNIMPHFYGVETSNGKEVALDFSPANELAELPVCLSDELRIWDERRKEYSLFGKPQYTFGQILEAIISELLFHGSRVERDKKRERHLRIVEDTKK